MIKVVLILFILLTSCANISYVLDTYDGDYTTTSKFEFRGKTYTISDRPDIGFVMITPSLGEAFRGGWTKADTSGRVNIHDNKELFSQITSAYLAKDRLMEVCELKEGSMILEPSWEFSYQCNDNQPQISN